MIRKPGKPPGSTSPFLMIRAGVSWQVAPRLLGEMIRKGTREQVDLVTQTFLPMKKLDIAALQRAYEET